MTKARDQLETYLAYGGFGPVVAKKPMNTRNSAIIEGTKYESRSGVQPPSGMVTQRWRSCDMSTIRIPLSSRKYPGLYALIDEADFELVGHLRVFANVRRHGAVYAWTRINGRFEYIHRILMDAKPGEIIDHINGDTLDNRRSNLRRATSSQNVANQRPNKRKATKTSRFLGVSWDASRNKWQVHLRCGEKRYNLGRYDLEESAARAFDRGAREHFGEFASLNFPEEGAA